MKAPSFAEVSALDGELAEGTFPPLSLFWRATLGRFLDSSRRTLTIRAGRRSGKSLTACKLAVAFALLGSWKVAPGELAIVAIVSVSLQEAQGKLGIIRAMLEILGAKVARGTGTELELADRPVAFRCFAASHRTAVGFGAALVVVDEAARLRDEATGANPCREVVAALRPSLATHPGARLLLVSSPLGRTDYHAESFARGDTSDQMVAHAPTWLANPTITEEQTHELEPDERVWAREYAARAQAGALAAFPEECIERALRPRDDLARRDEPVLIIDASSGKKDRFTAALATWCEAHDERHVLVFEAVQGFEPSELRKRGIEDVIDEIAATATRAGASDVFADQREAMMLESDFARHGLRFNELPWTASSKPRAVARVRRWLLEGRLALPRDERLRRELLSFEERIDASGAFTFGARGSGHDDFVALLITAALADEDRRLPGSPLAVVSKKMLSFIRDMNNRAARQAARDSAFGRSDTRPKRALNDLGGTTPHFEETRFIDDLLHGLRRQRRRGGF